MNKRLFVLWRRERDLNPRAHLSKLQDFMTSLKIKSQLLRDWLEGNTKTAFSLLNELSGGDK